LIVTKPDLSLMRRDALGIALFAFLLRVGVSLWAWERVPPTADGSFYHVVAQRIADGQGYTWLWPDGAVTYAAHYPIGYPALMGAVYGLFGATPGAVMIVNALLGAVGVWAVHGLCCEILGNSVLRPHRRMASGTASLFLAICPTILLYTPALMTEGAVGVVLVVAARAALAFRAMTAATQRTRAMAYLALGVALGVASLLRPQSIVLAPVLGYLCFQGTQGRRLMGAAIVFSVGLLVVAPWTARNCDKMERCVFVSANGGWNLLIGTFKEGEGAWVPLEGRRVPIECREVFQEAAKDKCFGQAGRKRILQDPIKWAALVPAKLRATFDFSAAASDHLLASGAIDSRATAWLIPLELVFQRLLFIGALLGAWAQAPSRASWLCRGLATVGLVGFCGVSVPLGWVSVLILLGQKPKMRDSLALGWAAAGLLSTMVIHSVFFGAGRYSLPLLYLVTPLFSLGVAWIWKCARPQPHSS
jgi:hypothetical protein